MSTLATVKRSMLEVAFPNMFLQIAYTSFIMLSLLGYHILTADPASL